MINRFYPLFLSLISFVFSLSTTATPLLEATQASKPIIIGEQFTIHSKILNEQRKLLVHLPESYHQSSDNDYPVLYTLDGATHFHHISGSVNWLSKQTGRIPEMIIVAIVNTDRRRDLTTSYNGGGADKFTQFIKTELIPYIDHKYRTRGFRVLAGHSMAGFFTVNTLLFNPELFNGYIAMSPWFHQDGDNQVLVAKSEKQLQKAQYASRFLFTSIGNEPALKPLYDNFIDLLTQFAPKQLEWQSQVLPLDNHMSVPSNTINNALQAMFADQRLSPDSAIAQQGIDAINAYYKKLSENKYGYSISPQQAINNLGYAALEKQQLDKASKIFKANIEAYPDSSNTYDSMADVLEAKREYTLALEMVNKAIEISLKQNERNLPWLQRHQTNLEKLIAESNSNNVN